MPGWTLFPVPSPARGVHVLSDRTLATVGMAFAGVALGSCLSPLCRAALPGLLPDSTQRKRPGMRRQKTGGMIVPNLFLWGFKPKCFQGLEFQGGGMFLQNYLSYCGMAVRTCRRSSSWEESKHNEYPLCGSGFQLENKLYV